MITGWHLEVFGWEQLKPTLYLLDSIVTNIICTYIPPGKCKTATNDDDYDLQFLGEAQGCTKDWGGEV